MNRNHNKKVFVAMSGGVDSSVAALLLKKQGYDVTGIYMRNWHEDLHDGFGECTWEEDQEDVRRVCARLDIPFYTWDFSQEYYQDVVEYFFKEYKAGRTPNPDVMCNKYIKFGRFFDRAMQLGAGYVATGHYVRNTKKGLFSNEVVMHEGKDPGKDQSYFLWTIPQKQLSRTLFPIGKYHKPRIRQMAQKADLHTAHKPDSQGICFIGQVDVREFIASRLKEKVGDIVTLDGEIVGSHNGVHFYTEGQRQGLNIGGTGEPYYIVKKDAAQNQLVVALGANNPALFSNHLKASGEHWVGKSSPAFPLNCSARVRYRQQPSERCVVDKKGDTLMVSFKNPQRAIAPGQSIVFYKGNVCLGGAIIDMIIDDPS